MSRLERRAWSGDAGGRCLALAERDCLGLREPIRRTWGRKLQVVPPGFVAIPNGQGFIDHVGPYYQRREADGSYSFGFLSDHRHYNMNGVFHGGVLLSFLDTILGHIVVQSRGVPCATVSFESKFIAGVEPGGWITGRARIRATTRTLAFCEGECLDGDKLLLTASGVFRIFEPKAA